MKFFHVAFDVALIVAILVTAKSVEYQKDRIGALEQQVKNLEVRADYTGLRQAMLDVKVKMMSGDWGMVKTDKSPVQYENDLFLKE